MVTRATLTQDYLKEAGTNIGDFPATRPASMGTLVFNGSANYASAYSALHTLDTNERTVKLTTGTASPYNAFVRTNNETDIPLTTVNDSIIVAIYVEQLSTLTENSAVDSAGIYLSKDNQSATSLGTLLGLKHLGWNIYAIPVSTLTGSGAASDVWNSYKVEIKNTTGENPTIAYVAGVWIKKRHKPKIILQFDDQFKSVYTEAYPYMSARGLVGEVAVIAEYVGQNVGGYDYCTLAELQVMQAAGWGMIVHGHDTHNTLGSASSIQADAAINADYIANNLGGGGGEKHYVYPGGIFNENSDTALSALGMVTAQTVIAGIIPTSYAEYGPYRMHRSGINNNTSAQVITKIDDAIKAGGTYILFGHNICTPVVNAATDITIANFQAAIDYLAWKVSQGLVDVTISVKWWNGRSAPRMNA